MSDAELRRPLTAIELAELTEAASRGLTSAGMMLLRRVAYQAETELAAARRRIAELEAELIEAKAWNVYHETIVDGLLPFIDEVVGQQRHQGQINMYSENHEEYDAKTLNREIESLAKQRMDIIDEAMKVAKEFEAEQVAALAPQPAKIGSGDDHANAS